MTSTGSETIIGNARIVLANRVIERGWIAFADGRIAGMGEGSAPSGHGVSRKLLLESGLPKRSADDATTTMRVAVGCGWFSALRRRICSS